MLRLPNRVLWQPTFYGRYDFGVSLDQSLAKDLLDKQVPERMRTRMNELGNMLLNQLGRSWMSPYSFEGESAFVKQISLGGNGVWLATDRIAVDALVKGVQRPVEYHSHNTDSLSDAYALMLLFGHWIEYSDVLLE